MKWSEKKSTAAVLTSSTIEQKNEGRKKYPLMSDGNQGSTKGVEGRMDADLHPHSPLIMVGKLVVEERKTKNMKQNSYHHVQEMYAYAEKVMHISKETSKLVKNDHKNQVGIVPTHVESKASARGEEDGRNERN
eukprot:2095036-Ditylum_brightwellii.AAC.1